MYDVSNSAKDGEGGASPPFPCVRGIACKGGWEKYLYLKGFLHFHALRGSRRKGGYQYTDNQSLFSLFSQKVSDKVRMMIKGITAYTRRH